MGCNLSDLLAFNRRRPFQPREPCPFSHPECAAVTLDSVVLNMRTHAQVFFDAFYIMELASLTGSFDHP